MGAKSVMALSAIVGRYDFIMRAVETSRRFYNSLLFETLPLATGDEQMEVEQM